MVGVQIATRPLKVIGVVYEQVRLRIKTFGTVIGEVDGKDIDLEKVINMGKDKGQKTGKQNMESKKEKKKRITKQKYGKHN